MTPDLTWPPLSIWDLIDDKPLCRRILSRGAARRGNRIVWDLSNNARRCA